MKPRITITSNLADTIVKIHNNGAFQIDCTEWQNLYQKARVVIAQQRVEDAQNILEGELAS